MKKLLVVLFTIASINTIKCMERPLPLTADVQSHLEQAQIFSIFLNFNDLQDLRSKQQKILSLVHDLRNDLSFYQNTESGKIINQKILDLNAALNKIDRNIQRLESEGQEERVTISDFARMQIQRELNQRLPETFTRAQYSFLKERFPNILG